jgi:soluble cytochrome b562
MATSTNSLEKLDKLILEVQKNVQDKKRLSNELTELNKKIKNLQEENKNQKNKLEVLEQQNKMVNIARVVSNLDEEEKKSLQHQISLQIKEIDQCIKLLKL